MPCCSSCRSSIWLDGYTGQWPQHAKNNSRKRRSPMPNGKIGTFGKSVSLELTASKLIEYSGGQLDRNAAKRLYEQMRRETLYKSEHYQIAIDKHPEHGFTGMTIWHLSIKR